MADTGAPWNLPYPLATDLVRDGAQAIEDLAEATATGLSAAGNEGIGPNVVQTIKDDTFANLDADTQDVTGLEVTITPSSTDSRILLLARISGNVLSSSSLRSNFLTFFRGSTNLVDPDTPGSRTASLVGDGGTGNAGKMEVYSLVHLDTPNTTSPVTYKIVSISLSSTGGSGVYINRAPTDTDSVNLARGTSALVAIEVAP